MRIIILCLLTARACLGQHYNLTIQEFKEQFNKTYGTPEEEAAAAKNLARNEAEINAQNEKFAKGEASYDEAVQPWDDLSEEEFKKQMTGLIIPPEHERINSPEVLAHFDNLRKLYNRQELPDFWDSRDPGLTGSPSGWITSVKQQQGCGSCTAFATNAAAEAALIKAGADFDSMDISEQWLLNCSPYGGGCCGAWPPEYAQWVSTRGVLMMEGDYPYTNSANKKNCKDGPYLNPGYKIDNFIHKNDCTDEEIMMQIKEHGSVVMTVVSGENGFTNEGGQGVFNGCTSPPSLPDHSVLAVGWGTLNGIDYWLIKNSWGTGWGENGYVRVKRGTCNTNYGCTAYTAVASTVCSKDSPCETNVGHCETNDMCQSGSCGSDNCPAIETCAQCPINSPDTNCCKDNGCGGHINAESGQIQSPNFPNKYGNNEDCTWVITAPAEATIILNFETPFEIENHSSCNYDYLEIRDGREPTATLLGEKHCGSTSPDEDKTQRWKLDGPMLKNKEGAWKSDDDWEFKPQINGLIYIENISKTKVLGSTSDGKVIEEVKEVGKAEQLWKKGQPDAEGYFTLQNSGEPKVLTAISESSLEIKDPNAIKSTGNTMFLKFHSDYSIGKKGFSASFSSKKKECGSDGRGKPQDIGNGFCDDYNNTPECDYDGGDCCGTCVNKEYCAEGACCDCWDGGAGNGIAASWIGNGNCDAGLNNAECQFDGGDCNSSDDCKDLVPEIWKAHYESNYGNICDNYVGPWNKCDTAWYYCDSKKCGEFCKKTCNKC